MPGLADRARERLRGRRSPRRSRSCRRPLARLLAGRPVRRDGQQLDVHVQLALRLERLLAAGAAARRPRPARVAATRRPSSAARGSRSARVARPRATRPGGPLGARLYEPERHAAAAAGRLLPRRRPRDRRPRHARPAVPRSSPARRPARGAGGRLPARRPSTASRPPVDDALAAFRWAHARGRELGADPERIAVAGDSAGGNLAAVVAQLARRRRRPGARLPGADLPGDRLLGRSAASYELFGEGFFLTREEMDWFRDNYFADAGDRDDPRASPILRRRSRRRRAGPRRHGRLRPAARRGRGLRRAPARARACRPPCAASPTWCTASSTPSASAAGRRGRRRLRRRPA